jgi:hypothetical protein
MRNYFRHMAINWLAAGKCLLLFFFHFIHGLIPCKLTEHEFWGFGDTAGEKEE